MPDLRLGFSRGLERVLRLPNHVVASTVLDLDVVGKDNLPNSDEMVVAANHFSHLDAPLIGTNLDRYIRFLAVDELYGNSRLFDTALGLLGAIPLDRDGYPVRALREAIDHITSGNAIGLFPEGRRVESWGIDDPKRGAAWLAFAAGAPLVPVAIHGTQHTLAPESKGLARTAVRIWIEEPLVWHTYLDRVDPLGAMMADWYNAVNTRLQPWMEAPE